MGVYVKDMQMPETCGKCKMSFLGEPDYVCCGVTDRVPKIVGKYHNSKIDPDARKKSIEGVERPEWCPLVEVPVPHGRLIDGDHLIRDEIKPFLYQLKNGDIAIPMIDIKHAQTVIEADGE